MSVFKLYSNRNQPNPERLEYDILPNELRIQFVQIWEQFFLQEKFPEHISKSTMQELAKILMKEHALEFLPETYYKSTIIHRIGIYFKSLEKVEQCIDVIELIILFIENSVKIIAQYGYPYTLDYSSNEVIEEINERFRIKGVGYQYLNSKILRLDSILLNSDLVEKTFNLLSSKMYSNVNTEFLTAHDHFRHKRNSDSVIWCLKSFESIIKIIANENQWTYKEDYTARPLIQLLFTNNFFPTYTEHPITHFKNFLENSISLIRNKKGGHGSGSEPNVVPDSISQYMLYITGATINLIVETQQEYNNQRS